MRTANSKLKTSLNFNYRCLRLVVTKLAPLLYFAAGTARWPNVEFFRLLTLEKNVLLKRAIPMGTFLSSQCMFPGTRGARDIEREMNRSAE